MLLELFLQNYTTNMKKFIPVTVILLFVGLLTGHQVQAQTKTGYVSFSELIGSMPESRKADTALSEYKAALEQQFEEYQREFTEQGNLLNSKDTLKYTGPQLDVKRKKLSDMYAKLQGFNQEASQLLEQKKQSLLTPIQAKAENAIQVVAKENGYGYIFEKDALHVYPPSDDVLPLVKKKLGIK